MCQPDRNLILPAYVEWENTAALEEYFTAKFWQRDFFSPTEISEQKFTVGFFFNDFFFSSSICKRKIFPQVLRKINEESEMPSVASSSA